LADENDVLAVEVVFVDWLSIFRFFLDGPSSSSSFDGFVAGGGNSTSSVHIPLALRSKAARFFWPIIPIKILAS
jgi:hypothetical protein